MKVLPSLQITLLLLASGLIIKLAVISCSQTLTDESSTKSQKQDFRVSLSVIFADGMFDQGFSYEDGKRKANNVEELQKMFKAHGSTEVYARISTRFESHNKGLERAKMAKKLGLFFNPEIGLFGTYSDVRWQYEPDFSDFPELGVTGKWSSLSLEQMQTILFDYGKLLAHDILNTGAEVIIWDLGNEVEYGVAGITINTGQGDKYRAPDAVDQAIGEMSKEEFFKMSHPDKISWLQKHIWPYEAKLFKAVSDGIRSVDPDARFSTHLSGVAAVDRKMSVAFFKAMNSGGYFPDELGLSYYPTGGMGQADRLKLFKENVISLHKELGQKVFIAEYGYPAGTMSGIFSWNDEIDGYPLSEKGQADFTRELVSWGSSTGLISGIRPWGPDLLHEGWLPMSFFNLNEKKATARVGLDAIQAGLKDANNRPNILFCISDDQSWLHAGATGDPVVKTPAFDHIAQEGILFTNAFCDAPSCGPSRSAILTGQHIWRLEEAGNIHSKLPEKFPIYTDLLEEAGYAIGSYSKAWSPGKFKNDTGWVHSGRSQLNPAGNSYKSFKEFFQAKPEDQPFCFWLGSSDAHRPYAVNSGFNSGMDPSKVIVPGHLPDDPVVRNDILDYYYEVQRWDSLVGKALSVIEEAGQLENTMVVITSDNGMPFPRAKASLYDFGTKMPMAISWPSKILSPNRNYEGFVHLSDLASTFLEAAGLQVPGEMTSKSLMDVFSGSETVPRESAYIAMERHDGCREGGKGYPCRALRTKDYLYIMNYEPIRWPSGNPDAKYCARAIPYGEVDSSPTKTLLLENEEKFQEFYHLAFGKRPAEELYDLKSDPGQIHNVAELEEYTEIKEKLSKKLQEYTAGTDDPRALGKDAPWDFYPYYGGRKNKDWVVDKKSGAIL